MKINTPRNIFFYILLYSSLTFLCAILFIILLSLFNKSAIDIYDYIAVTIIVALLIMVISIFRKTGARIIINDRNDKLEYFNGKEKKSFSISKINLLRTEYINHSLPGYCEYKLKIVDINNNEFDFINVDGIIESQWIVFSNRLAGRLGKEIIPVFTVTDAYN